MLSRAFNWFRTIAFYCSIALWTLLYPPIIILVIYFIPYKRHHRFAVVTWCNVVLVLVKMICGIRWKIEGTENIPDKGCVILSNHQSTWETFYLQTIFSPQSTVIKRELLNIPFFGWAFRFLSPIAIDRSDRKTSILQLINQGTHYLKKGNFVLIFPEGTRHDWPNLGKFSRGGAMLAKKSGFDLIPVVHNAGLYWPNKQWLKTPGVISVKIGPSISSTDKSTTELNKLAYEWVNNNQKTLN